MQPSRRRAFAPASGFACRFQIGEQGANPFPTHAGTGPFDVGETELTGLLADRREHQPGLCSTRRCDLTRSPFKFAIGAANDTKKVIEPWEKVMFALVPTLRALPEGSSLLSPLR